MRTSPVRSRLWAIGQAYGHGQLVPQWRSSVTTRQALQVPRPWTRQHRRYTYLAAARMADGTVAEIIEHPSFPDQTWFLITRGGQFGVTNGIVTPGGILLPLGGELSRGIAGSGDRVQRGSLKKVDILRTTAFRLCPIG